MMTAFIALDDCNKDNGCLQVSFKKIFVYSIFLFILLTFCYLFYLIYEALEEGEGASVSY